MMISLPNNPLRHPVRPVSGSDSRSLDLMGGLPLVLVDHVDLGGAVGPCRLGAVLVGEQGAVTVGAGRRQVTRHYGRTATDDKRRRRRGRGARAAGEQHQAKAGQPNSVVQRFHV